MNRPLRIINYTCTLANTWYKAYDQEDYKLSRVKSIKVKLREDTTASYFRYGFESSPASYMTSGVGFEKEIKTKELWIFIPDIANQTVEIELCYE